MIDRILSILGCEIITYHFDPEDTEEALQSILDIRGKDSYIFIIGD